MATRGLLGEAMRAVAQGDSTCEVQAAAAGEAARTVQGGIILDWINSLIGKQMQVAAPQAGQTAPSPPPPPICRWETMAAFLWNMVAHHMRFAGCRVGQAAAHELDDELQGR